VGLKAFFAIEFFLSSLNTNIPAFQNSIIPFAMHENTQ